MPITPKDVHECEQISAQVTDELENKLSEMPPVVKGLLIVTLLAAAENPEVIKSMPKEQISLVACLAMDRLQMNMIKSVTAMGDANG